MSSDKIWLRPRPLSNDFCIDSNPIVNGKLLLIASKWAGRESIGKKIPEKKIDINPIAKLMIFPTLKSIIKDAANSPIPINGNELYINRAKNIGMSKNEIPKPKKIFPIKMYINIRNIDLVKVSAYEENKIVNMDVFVSIRASKVPCVWATLISLENTDIEENIKSIRAIPISMLKNSICLDVLSPPSEKFEPFNA